MFTAGLSASLVAKPRPTQEVRTMTDPTVPSRCECENCKPGCECATCDCDDCTCEGCSH